VTGDWVPATAFCKRDVAAKRSAGERMTLQNRVTPFGDIVAIPQRGLFTGNRGILHDPATRTLLRRRWTTKAWIICRCEFKSVRRVVMGGRSWTELFFLDEATALAAGHRPCFFCRRDDALAFRAAWAVGNAGALPRAAEMDAALHHERLAGRDKRLHPCAGSHSDLPDGAMVAADDTAFLVIGGRLLRWSPAGYAERRWSPRDLRLLTPPSTVRALAAGYRASIHPSASASLAAPTLA
jgi:hypothetical protein